jgi:CBS domain-containing protein/ribosome-associated translation inhibitor RaiA
MKVKDIMSKDIIYLTPEDNVSKLISLIEEHCFREILVIENEKLKGIVYSKEIAKKGIIDPTKTKVNALIKSPPPILLPDQDVDDAADLIFKTGLRALPVVEDNKVIGIVSLHDIVDVASKTKEFRQTTASSIMSIPELIREDNDIGTARMLMREKNISRIPVLDRNQKLCGVVTIFDLLKAVKPRERISFYSMDAEKETTMEIPVSTVMNKMPTIATEKTTLNDIVNLIRKDETDGIIIVENNFPVGVITEKDLLEVYVSSLKKKGVYYQIIGLKDEDDFIIETIDRMIGDTLQKMSKIFETQFFFLHIKRYDKTGKIKYSIRTRFRTNKKTFVSKAFAWDLREAVDKALDNLERIMLKEKEEISSKSKEATRFKKLNR